MATPNGSTLHRITLRAAWCFQVSVAPANPTYPHPLLLPSCNVFIFCYSYSVLHNLFEMWTKHSLAVNFYSNTLTLTDWGNTALCCTQDILHFSGHPNLVRSGLHICQEIKTLLVDTSGKNVTSCVLYSRPYHSWLAPCWRAEHQGGAGCKWWPHCWRWQLPVDLIWAGEEPVGEEESFNFWTLSQSISWRKLQTKHARHVVACPLWKHFTVLPQLGGSQPPAGHHFSCETKPLSWAKP